MPSINPALNLLSASANYSAGDWAAVGGQGSLDIRPVAALNRGLDLGISAEALIQLDASIRKFIAIDASAFATASAGVRAQLQTPIDLFAEAGFALRLQAQAQAAVGVQLGIGLVVGDFLALVDSDPRLSGAPARLVRVLLEETAIGGGAMAKAAVAAMAYVNVSATGRLLPQGSQQPGFTVAVEKGAGWGAGAGIKGFVNFGVADPRNLLRRSVDVAVECTLDDLSKLLNDARTTQLVVELRTPLKIALRTAFEIGLELAQNGGAFAPNAAQTLALRCVQVFLEESQRCILDRAVRWAAEELRRSIGDLPFSNAAWAAAHAERIALVTELRNVPQEPFEATAANRTYWSGVVDAASRVLAALGGQTSPNDPGVEAIATIYAATQLLFVAVERISNGAARASVIGINPVTATSAFSGAVTAPSAIIKQHINGTIGRALGSAITQDALVTYLIEGRVLALVAAQSPELETIASMAAGESPGAIGAGFSTILSNIGAFTPNGSGGVTSQATLVTIVRGMRAYVRTRVESELIPALTEQLEGKPPELRNYLDEVLLSSLSFTLDVIFVKVLDWINGSAAGQTALREACSAVVMRLFGRSLVVTADAVFTRLLDGLSNAYADVAAHVNDSNGIAQKLLSVAATGPVSRGDLAEMLSEHFLVLSQASRPLDPGQRARIRDLLYRLIDTAPSSPDQEFTEQLMTDLGVRNLEAGKDLALEFGALWSSRFVDFVAAWLAHVGAKVLEILKEIVDAIVAEVAKWIQEVELLVRELAAQLEALLNEIGRLALELEQEMDAALSSAAIIATRLAATGTARTRLRSELKNVAINTCMGALTALPGYDAVPSWAKAQVRSALRAAVDVLLNNAVLNVVLDAIRGPALAAADFLRDLRDIEPGDDVTDAVMSLFLDRLEDGVREAFGGSSPHLDIRIRFQARATSSTPFGDVSLSFDVDIPLGSVRIPLAEIIDAVRAAAHALDAVADAVETVAMHLATAIHAELALAAAETEHAVVEEAHDESYASLVETYPASMEAVIVSPGQSSVVDSSVVAEIHLPGVPESYLGRESNAAQRVHVWLNQEELPMAGFTVREVKTARVFPSAGPRDSFESNMSPIPSGIVRRPKSPASRSAGDRTMRMATSPIPVRRQPHPLSDLRDSVRLSTRVPSFRLGRPIRLGEREVIEASSFPGVVLTQRLTAAMLVPGVNTLVVSLVDGRGRFRVEKSVTFVVVPAASRLKPPKGTRSHLRLPAPQEASYSLESMPPSVRDRLVRVVGIQASNTGAKSPKEGKRERKKNEALRPVNGLGPTWISVKDEREKTVDEERRHVIAKLEEKRTPLRELREAIRNGTLRPSIPSRPKVKLHVGSVIEGKQASFADSTQPAVASSTPNEELEVLRQPLRGDASVQVKKTSRSKSPSTPKRGAR